MGKFPRSANITAFQSIHHHQSLDNSSPFSYKSWTSQSHGPTCNSNPNPLNYFLKELEKKTIYGINKSQGLVLSAVVDDLETEQKIAQRSHQLLAAQASTIAVYRLRKARSDRNKKQNEHAKNSYLEIESEGSPMILVDNDSERERERERSRWLGVLESSASAFSRPLKVTE